ncbi:PREDICTED: uncharacterized protein LOC106817857 isoform X2 [Priapulus caudatus]|uniref:Uncharacterized protein LOC106817857 isoform X2 n=1 Tax=Priapulus caudatus TaxID=37621 RepID=A0ABM1F0T0_PRICU|nr:PREDICTED: uncharacterized protein LOC106817857 isoform X2 [Priapulus caudatus]
MEGYSMMEELEKRLETARDYDSRRKIRSRIRELKKIIGSDSTCAPSVSELHIQLKGSPMTKSDNLSLSTYHVDSITDSGRRQDVTSRINTVVTPGGSQVMQQRTMMLSQKMTNSGSSCLERDTILSKYRITPAGSEQTSMNVIHTTRLKSPAGTKRVEGESYQTKERLSPGGTQTQHVCEVQLQYRDRGSSSPVSVSPPRGQMVTKGSKVKRHQSILSKRVGDERSRREVIAKASSGYSSGSASDEDSFLPDSPDPIDASLIRSLEQDFLSTLNYSLDADDSLGGATDATPDAADATGPARRSSSSGSCASTGVDDDDDGGDGDDDDDDDDDDNDDENRESQASPSLRPEEEQSQRHLAAASADADVFVSSISRTAEQVAPSRPPRTKKHRPPPLDLKRRLGDRDNPFATTGASPLRADDVDSRASVPGGGDDVAEEVADDQENPFCVIVEPTLGSGVVRGGVAPTMLSIVCPVTLPSNDADDTDDDDDVPTPDAGSVGMTYASHAETIVSSARAPPTSASDVTSRSFTSDTIHVTTSAARTVAPSGVNGYEETSGGTRGAEKAGLVIEELPGDVHELPSARVGGSNMAELEIIRVRDEVEEVSISNDEIEEEIIQVAEDEEEEEEEEEEEKDEFTWWELYSISDGKEQKKMDSLWKVNDINQLENMLVGAQDFETRRVIRSRLQEVKRKHKDEREAMMRKNNQSLQLRSAPQPFEGMQQQHMQAEAEWRRQAELSGFEDMAMGNPLGANRQVIHETRTGPGGTTVMSTRNTFTTHNPNVRSYHNVLLQDTRAVTNTGNVVDYSHLQSPDDAEHLVQRLSGLGDRDGSGSVTITRTQTSMVNGKSSTETSTKTHSFGNPAGGNQARLAFQKLDAVSNPKPMRGATIRNDVKAVKAELLDYCQSNTQEYDSDVEITNFSSSWANGVAFCALVHHYFPRAFDFGKINPKNRKANFTMAFKVAEDLGGVYPLLEVEDMLMMGNRPDWKCVFTYVQALYRHLKDRQPGVP